MDRQKPKRAVRGSPMQTPWDPSIQLLLSASSYKPVRAMVDETHRRDVYSSAVFRLEENHREFARGRPQHQSQTRPADHETPWDCQHSTRTPCLKTPPRTCQISVFTPRPGSFYTPRSVELRHHLYSASARICVSRSRDRLVQPSSSLFPFIKQLGDAFLFRSLRRGYQSIRMSSNLQYRPRRAIYIPGICESRSREKYPLQHGWKRKSSGQYFCRTALEVRQV